MTGIVKAMGKAGIPYLHLYSSNEIVPGDGPERECLWAGLVEYYRELTDVAEDVGVKVSTHHFHRPDRILWNLATMEQLFQEVDSPANGVIFCQGKSELAGDDLGAAVRAFGNRTFMVHIRDIVTRVTDPIDKEVQERLKGLGYLEVAFGTGEVDMVETFKGAEGDRLQRADLSGALSIDRRRPRGRIELDHRVYEGVGPSHLKSNIENRRLKNHSPSLPSLKLRFSGRSTKGGRRNSRFSILDHRLRASRASWDRPRT